MRTRKELEIQKSLAQGLSVSPEYLILEVLLDIRDLLNKNSVDE